MTWCPGGSLRVDTCPYVVANVVSACLLNMADGLCGCNNIHLAGAFICLLCAVSDELRCWVTQCGSHGSICHRRDLTLHKQVLRDEQSRLPGFKPLLLYSIVNMVLWELKTKSDTQLYESGANCNIEKFRIQWLSREDEQCSGEKFVLLQAN